MESVYLKEKKLVYRKICKKQNVYRKENSNVYLCIFDLYITLVPDNKFVLLFPDMLIISS